MKTITVLWNGLEISVPVTYFNPGHAMPIASTPDSPGYDDDGDPGDVEFGEPELVNVDCAETFMDWLKLQDNESFIDLVFQEMIEANREEY